MNIFDILMAELPFLVFIQTFNNAAKTVSNELMTFLLLKVVLIVQLKSTIR